MGPHGARMGLHGLARGCTGPHGARMGLHGLTRARTGPAWDCKGMHANARGPAWARTGMHGAAWCHAVVLFAARARSTVADGLFMARCSPALLPQALVCAPRHKTPICGCSRAHKSRERWVAQAATARTCVCICALCMCNAACRPPLGCCDGYVCSAYPHALTGHTSYSGLVGEWHVLLHLSVYACSRCLAKCARGMCLLDMP